MRIVLLTTHQYGKRPTTELLRLIETVQRQEARVETMLYCVLQGVRQVPDDLAGLEADGRLTFVPSENFLSLSKARNLLLKTVPIANDDIIIFPDDDCFFQEGLLDFIADVYRSKSAELFFLLHGEPPDNTMADAQTRIRPANLLDPMRRVCSANITLIGKLAKEVGLFDEQLGLGARFPGGEDTDYAIRCWRLSKASFFVPDRLVGHRAINVGWSVRVKEMGRYWPGLMIATFRHFDASLIWLLLYRVGAGLYLTLSGRLKWRMFLQTMSVSLGFARSNRLMR